MIKFYKSLILYFLKITILMSNRILLLFFSTIFIVILIHYYQTPQTKNLIDKIN
jgi:hypothetical protein